MRRNSAVALAFAVGIAACSETVTSPDQAVVGSPSYARDAVDNPPPPPADIEALGEAILGSSELLSSAAGNPYHPGPGDLGAFQFAVSTTYMYNKPGNSGWLQIKKPQDANVVVSNAAKVSYKQGVFSGNGTIVVTLATGILTFDLANVSQNSSFASCSVPQVSPPSISAVPSRPEGSCFYVEIDDAIFQPFVGPAQPATVIISPACFAGDPLPFCISPPPVDNF